MTKPTLPSGAWLVFAGDSRTDPSGDVGPGPTGTWPYFLSQTCPYIAAPVAAGNFYNFAGDSQRTTEVLAQFAAGAYSANPNHQPVYFFAWVGINDLLAGGLATVVYANLCSIWSQARALGYKVVAFTTGTAATTAAIVAQIEALDRLIAGDAGRYDLLIRPDTITPVRPEFDPDHHWYLDGLHPNAAGNARIAAAVAAALDP